MTQIEQLVELLKLGPVRAWDAAKAIGVKRHAVAPLISRLRSRKYKILTESTETSGDPRYTLLALPNSLRHLEETSNVK